MLFGLTYQQVFPAISKIANLGNVVIPDLWNLNPYLTVLAVCPDGRAAVLPDRPGRLAAQGKKRIIDQTGMSALQADRKVNYAEN